MRLLAPARCAIVFTRPPNRPLAANSSCAAVRMASRVRSGSRLLTRLCLTMLGRGRNCRRLTVFRAASIVAVTNGLPRKSGARRANAQLPFSGRSLMKLVCKLAIAAAAVAFAVPASAQPITFTLNWVAGGDHAPYFYAQKMGWYKDAGLDVTFETGRGSAASAQKVGAGASQLGLSDMAGVLLFRGKGLDLVGIMNVYANSPQGMYWLKRSGLTGVKDFACKKIGNPAGDGARTMWPALAKKGGIDPNSVTWVNIDANAKLGALKAHTIDVATSFFNLHHVFARELGDDMGFLAWKDAGVNPYGNSIIANGPWLKANRDKA